MSLFYLPIVFVPKKIALIWEFEEDRILWDEDEKHYYVSSDDEDYREGVSPITEIVYSGDGSEYTYMIFRKRQLSKSLRKAQKSLIRMIF